MPHVSGRKNAKVLEIPPPPRRLLHAPPPPALGWAGLGCARGPVVVYIPNASQPTPPQPSWKVRNSASWGLIRKVGPSNGIRSNATPGLRDKLFLTSPKGISRVRKNTHFQGGGDFATWGGAGRALPARAKTTCSGRVRISRRGLPAAVVHHGTPRAPQVRAMAPEVRPGCAPWRTKGVHGARHGARVAHQVRTMAHQGRTRWAPWRSRCTPQAHQVRTIAHQGRTRCAPRTHQGRARRAPWRAKGLRGL